jgi:hypothetical protein
VSTAVLHIHVVYISTGTALHWALSALTLEYCELLLGLLERYTNTLLYLSSCLAAILDI